MSIKKKKLARADELRRDRRVVTDLNKREYMLAVLIRNRRAFESVQGLLKPEHLAVMGGGYAVVWRVVNQFHKEFKALPAKDQLMAELHDALNDDVSLMDPGDAEAVDSFLDWAFDDVAHGGKDLARSKLHAKAAVGFCKTFLDEVVATRLREVIYQGNTVPADIPAVLLGFQQQVEMNATLTATAPDELFYAGWDKEPLPPRTRTRARFFDVMTGGGFCGGEAYVFMAPQGTCKTVISTQLAANFAVTGAELWAGAGPEEAKPVVFFVSTEPDARDVRIRLLAHLAGIPKKRLRKLSSLDQLSKESKPAATRRTAYEARTSYRASPLLKTLKGKNFLSEYERAVLAVEILKNHLVFLNMTESNRERESAGAGGMPEVASAIRTELNRRKDIRPCFIVLDHAAAMVDRMIERGDNHRQEDRQHLLKAMPMQARKLALKYDVPFLLIHQLRSAVTGYLPAAKLHHSDAEWCKGFAQYADFAFVVGNFTKDGRRLGVCRCTKHRHEPPREDMVVQLRGAFNRVVDASTRFTVDDAAKTIVTHEELRGRRSDPGRGASPASEKFSHIEG